MKTKLVLFDLDGTLLPMDQDVFTKAYFKLLAQKLAPRGYRPETLVDAIWKGTAAMVRNGGERTNEEAFWDTFAKLLGREALEDRPLIEEFYRVEFQAAAKACGYTAEAEKTVALCRRLGLRVALATNPIFPAAATESRIRWAGLRPEDFELYTTYEDSHFCKPNPDYYREVLSKLGCAPEETVMVGNDADEDLAAAGLGVRVFLLTDCLINWEGRDLAQTPHGDYAGLQSWLAREA